MYLLVPIYTNTNEVISLRQGFTRSLKLTLSSCLCLFSTETTGVHSTMTGLFYIFFLT